jgi:tetratricopeptide (TPR) repeat protein
MSACAGLERAEWPQGLERLPPAHLIAAVPFYPQEEYQCGPAALAMALSYAGFAATPEALTASVYTPSRKGSLQPDMITAARRRGALAYEISGLDALLQELAAGHAVIVLENLGLSWYPLWHYAVVIGYDMPGGRIILHSGREAGKPVPLGVFQNCWSRSRSWGLVVLEPSRLPATAEEARTVQAAIGLERAGQPAAAAAAYQAALERWPQSLAAWIGLGNSRCAVGDLTGAEAAFREAAYAHPDSGAAFNNLAHVLALQGRRPEALAAARRAVTLGGPHRRLFEETLRQIESSPADE